MWTIIKFDNKNLEFLKKGLKKKLGQDFYIYRPKLFIQKYKKNNLLKKELHVLGDYLFCFHKSFKNPQTINKLKFTKGLKYFLEGFIQSQDEIKEFVDKCKKSENEEGYLSQNFFDLCINSKYKFNTGPFSEIIFKIIGLQKNKINILLGNVKTTFNKDEFLFSSV